MEKKKLGEMLNVLHRCSQMKSEIAIDVTTTILHIYIWMSIQRADEDIVTHLTSVEDGRS